MVGDPGIEPGSSALQADAEMTTLAHHRLKRLNCQRTNSMIRVMESFGGPLENRTPIFDVQGQCNPIILAAHITF